MEDNFLISINLMRLKNVSIKDVKDEKGGSAKCVVIPVKENNLFISQRGDAYVGFNAWYNKDFEYGTHEVKRTLTKEEYTNMTTTDKKKMPNVGSMRPLGYKKKNKEDKVIVKQKFDINNMPF